MKKVIFLNLVVVIIFSLSSCEEFGTTNYDVVGHAQKGPFNIGTNITLVELSKTLQYYKGLEDEHNALLEKQPLFENKINITESSDVFVPQDSVEGIDEDDNMGVSTEESEFPPEEELILEVFDHIRLNISNTASVLKVFFIDPLK